MQYKKLQRFRELPGFPADSVHYVNRRIRELADSRCVAAYRWDGGGPGWNASYPMDSELLVHIFASFFDMILPPVGSASTPAQAPVGAFGSTTGLFGSASSALQPSMLSSSAPALKNGSFWAEAPNLVNFSSRHMARATEKLQIKSDTVLVQQQHVPSSRKVAVGASSTLKPTEGVTNEHQRMPPRFSLICDRVEWVVVQGEHNAWESLVLFLFHRAKRDGYLGTIDLRQGVLSSFMHAMQNKFIGSVDDVPDMGIADHGPLSILQPWSQELDDVDLDRVASSLE